MTLTSGAAVAALFAARPHMGLAQRAEGRVPLIGALWLGSQDSMKPFITARDETLRQLGYVEGRNLLVEQRFADWQAERLTVLAAELVGLNVDLILVGTNIMIDAARRETTTIPIVMAYGVDPIGEGYIASFRRPGGNITGLAWDPTSEIAAKYVEFLGEVIPRTSHIAAVWDPALAPNRAYLMAADAAAQSLGFTLEPLEVRAAGDLPGFLAALVERQCSAVMVLNGPALFLQRGQIAELAARRRLPTIFMWREGPDAGGLMSYGTNLRDSWRRAAGYVDKILKGAKPANLPVQQPTKFELIINLKTAKALGLTIPPAIMARADEVIE